MKNQNHAFSIIKVVILSFALVGASSCLIEELTEGGGTSGETDLVMSPQYETQNAGVSQLISMSGTYCAPCIASLDSTTTGGTVSVSLGGYLSVSSDASPGTVTVKGIDTQGGTATKTINILSALVLSSATVTKAVNTNQTFTASGGLAPYVFLFSRGADPSTQLPGFILLPEVQEMWSSRTPMPIIFQLPQL